VVKIPENGEGWLRRSDRDEIIPRKNVSKKGFRRTVSRREEFRFFFFHQLEGLRLKFTVSKGKILHLLRLVAKGN